MLGGPWERFFRGAEGKALAEATQVAHPSACDPGLEKAKGSRGMPSPSSLALLSAPCCHFYPRISFEPSQKPIC